MNGIMLDFGCGSKPYKELFNVDKYIGLDIERSGHDHKKEQIDFYYDGKTIPFKNEYFDSVFSSEVFEHVFNFEEILRELNRVLKKNSYMLVTLPFIWDEHEAPFDFARYTTFGIKFLLKKNGFKIINIEKSTNDIETIFQMWSAYLYQDFFPKSKYLKFLMTVLFISLFNLLGMILSFMLPKNNNFYHNSIIVAKKIADL